jgi:hypothetical protein
MGKVDFHSRGTFLQFQTAVKAVLEHHFNNHEHCEVWCKHGHGTEEEKPASGLRSRCKEWNKELHLCLKQHHEKFMEESKLRQLWRRYDANLVEAFNKFLTKFLPKDKTCCQTMENKARSMITVGRQSIGYLQFCTRMFERTGIQSSEEDITGCFLRKEDADKLWRKLSRRRENVKIERMRKHCRKMKEGVDKLVADTRKDLACGPGMMGPAGEESDPTQKEKRLQSRREKSTKICGHCGITGHVRTSSKFCFKNLKNVPIAAETAAASEAATIGK